MKNLLCRLIPTRLRKDDCRPANPVWVEYPHNDIKQARKICGDLRLDESSGAPGAYNVFHTNGMPVGVIYKEVDGFYVFLPTGRANGYWDEYTLTTLSKVLLTMNARWERFVNADLGRMEKELRNGV